MTKPQILVYLVVFTEDILNGKLRFLCSDDVISKIQTFPNLVGLRCQCNCQNLVDIDYPEREESYSVFSKLHDLT